MDVYTPSLDWGDELVLSALWVAKAWAISAVCIVVILALIARFTTWGRQFWHVTGDYFTGRDSAIVWAWLGGLLLLVMTAVRLDVLYSYQANDQYTAVQAALSGADEAVKASGRQGFWIALGILMILAIVNVTLILVDLYAMQRFILRWRVWLTNRLTADWLDDRAYYRERFVEAPIDNPDQRIQQDIDVFTTVVGPQTNNPTIGTTQTLLFGSVRSIVSVVAFAPILWELSGPLTIFGVTAPKALFWIVLIYVAVTTVAAFWIGRPLIRLSFRNQATNAAFRYALVRLRDAAEAVAFYRGERTESVTLRSRFAAVVDNYRKFILRGLVFLGWNQAMNRIVDPLPLLIQANRLLDGHISLGDITQSSNAFLQVHDSLAYFRSVYDSFASYRATIIRLDGLATANTQARELPKLTAAPSTDGAVALEDVEVRSPAGAQLIDPLDVRLEPGDAMVVTGPSGCGKTTLLRSLAQLWPFTSGTVRYPNAHNETLFLSQLPYIPLGNLRTVVSYPAAGGEFDPAAIRRALDTVALGHLASRLDEDRDWAKVLSPGEQQRTAFARVLLNRPRAVFLDESTSALDEGQEFALYRALRADLPETIVVSVSHRPAIEQHHNVHLRLLGGGEWRVEPVGATPSPA